MALLTSGNNVQLFGPKNFTKVNQFPKSQIISSSPQSSRSPSSPPPSGGPPPPPTPPLSLLLSAPRSSHSSSFVSSLDNKREFLAYSNSQDAWLHPSHQFWLLRIFVCICESISTAGRFSQFLHSNILSNSYLLIISKFEKILLQNFDAEAIKNNQFVGVVHLRHSVYGFENDCYQNIILEQVKL